MSNICNIYKFIKLINSKKIRKTITKRNIKNLYITSINYFNITIFMIKVIIIIKLSIINIKFIV